MSTDTWLGLSADWSQASGWSQGASPSAGSTASLLGTNYYVVTLFGTATAACVIMAAAGAELYETGALTLGGSFALQAGTLDLAGGTLSGGTLALQGGTLLANGGTLSGMAVQGTLALTSMDATLFVQNGLALSGAGGSGVGSIALTGSYAALDFVGSQSLNNADISIGANGAQPGGNAPGASGPAVLAVADQGGAGSGATLTIGSGVWINETGGTAELIAGNASPLPQPGLPAALINQGTITASLPGTDLLLAGNGTFTNQGTIAVSNTASLTIESGGFVNTGLIAVNDATLALAGTYATSLLGGLGAVSLQNGTVALQGTAINSGGTLSVGAGSALSTALGALALEGTLLGGVVLDTGSGLNFTGTAGVLQGVTYEGTLNLTGAGAGVSLSGGSQISSQGGGPGSLAITGAGATLDLLGSEALNNATITLGSAGQTASIGTSDAWLASTGTTATLGPSVSITQTGLNAALDANGWSPIPGFGIADTLVNQGSISADVAGGQMALSGYGTLINQGTIAVGNGETLSITVQDFANTGTLSIGLGGTALLGTASNPFGAAQSWSNSGQIVVGGGTLSLSGGFSTSQLGHITASQSASVVLAGTLANAGQTLTLGGSAQGGGLVLPNLSLTGTISGGTVIDPGGVLQAGPGGTALLDGVSYQGTLALNGAGATLRIRDGLVLNGAADIVGAGSVLDFVGSQSVSGGSIVLGATGSPAAIDVSTIGNGSSTLTLAAGLLVSLGGTLAEIGRPTGLLGGTILNQGRITGGVAGGTLTLGGENFVNQGSIALSGGETLSIQAQSFSNTGSILVQGGMLSIGGSLTLQQLGNFTLSGARFAVSGTLDLGGAALGVGAAAPNGPLALTGTLCNGAIVDSGGGLAVGPGAALENVTYRGVINLTTPFETLTMGGAMRLLATNGSAAGSIVLTGADTKLLLNSSETISATHITLGSPAITYIGQSIPAPELVAEAGTTLTLANTTTLTSIGLDGSLGDANLGQWDDSIVNAGVITQAAKGGTLTLGSTLFTNTGSLIIGNGGKITVGDAGFVNDGSISVGSLSALQVSLLDFFEAPDAPASVFTNLGLIAMAGGTLLEINPAGLFPNEPILNQAGGRLLGHGTVTAQVSNSGTIESLGGTLALSQQVLGSGALQIAPLSKLQLNGAVAANQSVQFLPTSASASTGGTLSLLEPGLFAGTLTGFTSTDSLDLAGKVLTGISIANGTLVASTSTQSFSFATSATLNGLLEGSSDTHGGTDISYMAQTGGTGNSGNAPSLVSVGAPNMLFWAANGGDVFSASSALLTGAHISNWSSNDSLDITDMAPASAALSLQQAAGVTTLTITDGTHSVHIGLTGSFTPSQFHLAADGHGGTAVSFHS